MSRPEELEQLSRLLAGELPDDEAAALHAAIERDPGLQQAWARLIALDALVHELPVTDAQHVAAAAARAARPPRRSPARWLALAAGLVLALGAGLWWWNGRVDTEVLRERHAVAATSVQTLNGTELLDDGDAKYRLINGTVLIDGVATVRVGDEQFAIDGRALVTTEPSAALSHVTDLVTPTNEVTLMIQDSKKSWATAVIAVMVFSGSVQAADKIPAGRSYAVPARTKASPPPEVLTARPLPGVQPPAPRDVVNVAGMNKAVLAQGSAISACYERALKTEPTLAGDVTLLLDLDRDGRLLESTVSPKSTLQHLGVTQCVLAAMQQVKFPPVKDVASAQFSYTLGFSRRGDNGSELKLPADGDCESCTYVNDRSERVTVEAGTSPSTGPADAKVTVVLFSEAECSYCIKAHEVLRGLMKQYEGRVRFVYKHHPLPVHASARPAAIALQAAAAQGRFWDMLDVTYQAPVSPETGLYDAQARSLGLDLQRYRRDVEAPATAAAVDADAALAKQLGVKGVPAWFINGKEIVGHRPLDVMKEAIDAELKK